VYNPSIPELLSALRSSRLLLLLLLLLLPVTMTACVIMADAYHVYDMEGRTLPPLDRLRHVIAMTCRVIF
jgi:hypothetical protein